MNVERTYKQGEFAKLLGVTVKTLQRCDVSGKLRANRSPTDWRYYTHEQYLALKGIKEILVVNNEKASPQEELVQDIISILHVFSCRLDGLRKYKKQIEGDDELVKSV